MMQYDVKAAHIEATGTIVSERTRLKGYQCLIRSIQCAQSD
jgi:hypothetical protein